MTLNNGLSSSAGTISIGALAVLQAGGSSEPDHHPWPRRGASGIIQAVSPLVLANNTGPFNFYGLIDTQDTSVTIVSPVRSQLSYINLGSPSALGTALISSSGGIVMPNSNGGDSGAGRHDSGRGDGVGSGHDGRLHSVRLGAWRHR